MIPLAFVALPLLLASSWYLGRKSIRDKKELLPGFRYDYFQGLNYLINEQPDKAVDVFIKLLEVDSDTVETHLALGSLFRRRGEVERAIRIHQNLIARPQLDKHHRLQALTELGQDYLKAGVLDRAERLFLELVELGADNQYSLNYLLYIYQQEKDWYKAIDIANKLQTLGQNMEAIIAQYHCELAQQWIDKNENQLALIELRRAHGADSSCVRASMMRAEFEYHQGDYKESLRYYKKIIDQDADYISEIVSPLTQCYRQLGEEEKMIQFLKQCLQRYPRYALILEISNYLKQHQGDKIAIEFIAEHIQQQPSLRGLMHLVSLYLMNSNGDAKEKLLILESFMKKLLAEKPIYRCAQCGFSAKTLFWLCPSCHHWSSLKPILGLEGS